MNFNCSNELKSMHARYVNELLEKREHPSATSGCEFFYIRKCDKSRNYRGVHYHPTLLTAMETNLGHTVGDSCGMTTRGRSLTVGVCAEQHAANDVLNGICPCCTIPITIENLVFSEAIRPKGKRIIPPCCNCQTLFTE